MTIISAPNRAERLLIPFDRLITITVPPKAESAKKADIKISARLLAGFLTRFLIGKELIERMLFLFSSYIQDKTCNRRNKRSGGKKQRNRLCDSAAVHIGHHAERNQGSRYKCYND